MLNSYNNYKSSTTHLFPQLWWIERCLVVACLPFQRTREPENQRTREPENQETQAINTMARRIP